MSLGKKQKKSQFHLIAVVLYFSGHFTMVGGVATAATPMGAAASAPSKKDLSYFIRTPF